MMLKLDLKTDAYRIQNPVQNGLMQNVNIFCTENENTFYAPTKNIQIG